MKKIERCFVCDEPTGNAGRHEDSLYGDESDGPYCRSCRDKKYPQDKELDDADHCEAGPRIHFNAD